MRALTPALLLTVLAVGACDRQPAAPPARRNGISVRSASQKALFKLDALNRAIALKRGILASGSTCKRITKSGFVGPYKNLDMWTATCDDGATSRDWAIFIGADDSVQVRLCKDTQAVGLPACSTARPGTEGGSGVAKK